MSPRVAADDGFYPLLEGKGGGKDNISAELKTEPGVLHFSWLHRTFWFSGVNSNGVSGLFSGVSLCFRERKRKMCENKGVRKVFRTDLLREVSSQTVTAELLESN